MQCRRCKMHFDYDKYYGICPGCAYFNRPDGKEEMDLFTEEEGSRFEREEDYRMPELEGSHEGLHRQYDVSKKPHKKTRGKRTSWREMEKRNGRSGGKEWIIVVVVVSAVLIAAAMAFAVNRKKYIHEETETVRAEVKTENFHAGEEILLPDGRAALFENAQTVAVWDAADYLPAGKKLIRIKTFVIPTDEYDSGTWWFDAPSVKNSELYCYPVNPEVADGPEKYEEMLEKCMISLDFLTEEYGDEGYAYLYYVVDEGLEKSQLHFSAWEDYGEYDMPGYVWDVDFTIEVELNE